MNNDDNNNRTNKQLDGVTLLIVLVIHITNFFYSFNQDVMFLVNVYRVRQTSAVSNCSGATTGCKKPRWYPRIMTLHRCTGQLSSCQHKLLVRHMSVGAGGGRHNHSPSPSRTPKTPTDRLRF